VLGMKTTNKNIDRLMFVTVHLRYNDINNQVDATITIY